MSAAHIVAHQRALPNLAGPEATPRTRFLAAELKRLQDAVLAEAKDSTWTPLNHLPDLVEGRCYLVLRHCNSVPFVGFLLAGIFCGEDGKRVPASQVGHFREVPLP